MTRDEGVEVFADAASGTAVCKQRQHERMGKPKQQNRNELRFRVLLKLRNGGLQERNFRQHTTSDVNLPLQLRQFNLQHPHLRKLLQFCREYRKCTNFAVKERDRADLVLPLEKLVLAVAHDLLLYVALLVTAQSVTKSHCGSRCILAYRMQSSSLRSMS